MLNGVVAILGPTNVVLGNAIAAVAMTDFIGRTADGTE